MSLNPLFFVTPEESTFSVSVMVKKDEKFGAGIVPLKDLEVLIKSLGLSLTGYATSIQIDIVHEGANGLIWYLAVAPRSATAPTKPHDFFSVPGRRFAYTNSDKLVASVSSPMPSALSYKVKGEAIEDKPSAVIVIGVQSTVAVSIDTTLHFGLVIGTTSQGKGFVTGGSATAIAATSA